MLYIPLTAKAPTVETYLPFSDNVAQQFGIPAICGPKNYSIVQAYSFVQIQAPVGDPYADLWTI